jgi:integrase
MILHQNHQQQLSGSRNSNLSCYFIRSVATALQNLLTRMVNGIYKGAGISGATSHSGRWTGLTNLAERGVGVRTPMVLAGHINMATIRNATLTYVQTLLKLLLSLFSLSF